MSGASPSAQRVGAKNSCESLAAVGGTGQGVPESKTEALFPEQRRNQRGSATCIPAPPIRLTRHPAQRRPPTTPSARSRRTGSLASNTSSTPTLWEGRGGKRVTFELREAEFLRDPDGGRPRTRPVGFCAPGGTPTTMSRSVGRSPAASGARPRLAVERANRAARDSECKPERSPEARRPGRSPRRRGHRRRPAPRSGHCPLTHPAALRRLGQSLSAEGAGSTRSTVADQLARTLSFSPDEESASAV
jgi:hypothetical protein